MGGGCSYVPVQYNNRTYEYANSTTLDAIIPLSVSVCGVFTCSKSHNIQTSQTHSHTIPYHSIPHHKRTGNPLYIPSLLARGAFYTPTGMLYSLCCCFPQISSESFSFVRSRVESSRIQLEHLHSQTSSWRVS